MKTYVKNMIYTTQLIQLGALEVMQEAIVYQDKKEFEVLFGC